jgi:hypothetical protein
MALYNCWFCLDEPFNNEGLWHIQKGASKAEYIGFNFRYWSKTNCARNHIHQTKLKAINPLVWITTGKPVFAVRLGVCRALFLGRTAKIPLCRVFLFTHGKNSLPCVVFFDARQKTSVMCLFF